MSFEKMPQADRPTSLLDALKAEIAEAEKGLEGHYKKGSGDDTYKEGKDRSIDLLALRKAFTSLESAGGDIEAAVAALADEIKEDAVANPEVYVRAKALLERRSQMN